MAASRTESITTHKNSTQEFLDRLLEDGRKTTCDDSNENFENSLKLPEFYDEDLFKKGQQFFYKHIYGMFFSKLCGLIAILSVPSILRILIMTKMSGTNMTAYRRYVATIFHMMVWYDKDFKPGSDLWNSIAEVRRLHNTASKKGKRCSLNHISQMDMAVTQFGFMGFALCRSRKVGIHNATDEEWASFIHVWRVVGHLLGIEDRFNICRENVAETRQICEKLISYMLLPNVAKMNKDFLDMAHHLIDGLWSVNPMLHYESTMSICHNLMTLEDDNQRGAKPLLFELQGYAKFNFSLTAWAIDMLKYDWFRTYHNFLIVASLWLVTWFPFLALYRYGIVKSYVSLPIKHVK